MALRALHALRGVEHLRLPIKARDEIRLGNDSTSRRDVSTTGIWWWPECVNSGTSAVIGIVSGTHATSRVITVATLAGWPPNDCGSRADRRCPRGSGGGRA